MFLPLGFRWGHVHIAALRESAGDSTGCQRPSFSPNNEGRLDALALLWYLLLHLSVVFGLEKDRFSSL